MCLWEISPLGRFETAAFWAQHGGSDLSFWLSGLAFRGRWESAVVRSPSAFGRWEARASITLVHGCAGQAFQNDSKAGALESRLCQNLSVDSLE